MPTPTPLTFLLQGLALGLTAAASPGPFQTYLISQALTGGWRRSAPIAFAPLISDPPIILAILLFLNQLPPQFLQIISLVGGLFVLYMAWGLWKSWRIGAGEATEEAGPPRGGVLRGVLMNTLSPGPYTFWTLVCGPLLLSALLCANHGLTAAPSCSDSTA